MFDVSLLDIIDNKVVVLSFLILLTYDIVTAALLF